LIEKELTKTFRRIGSRAKIMYEQKEIEAKQSLHMAFANEVSCQIIRDFNPYQQNEILLFIKQKVSENRQLMIEKVEKELIDLQRSLNDL
jgi:hypothetical protein